ncbi:Uncharacterised protein [Mycobacteroides abscessus subsp. abscessus]|nr:Uncharacterised protein [Mycobacteroides abscessus subsp. abscessus]SHW31897.1 Uncharacterised protein [Mycobacteroides abscessus subsp. abscessus]SHW40329.1 Uncharacterised protein [Mycobacteroides abscessus subsp. abscessus]SHW67198.1 Uncharacterised protein [Mycobacteroides abscessus subsp. abscessus]SHX17761.1 Uncharacterised protein [Mycobacteroides abscessus subsp. abscessus]
MRLMTGQTTQRVTALVTGCGGGALIAFAENIQLGAGIIGLGFLLIGVIGAWGHQNERSLTVGELVARYDAGDRRPWITTTGTAWGVQSRRVSALRKRGSDQTK